MNKYLFDQFLETVLHLQSKEKLQQFLEAVLTPKELDEIPKRLEIVKLLKSGVSQRVISEKLGVGIATITRGSKEIQKGNFENIQPDVQ